MRKVCIALCLALLAVGLVPAIVGCGHNDGAGSADPHHYTAAEARAAFLQHMHSAGPGRMPTRPATPGSPPAAQAGTQPGAGAN